MAVHTISEWPPDGAEDQELHPQSRATPATIGANPSGG